MTSQCTSPFRSLPASFSWSTCSYDELLANYEMGTSSCLMDVPDPDSIFGNPTCGNEIIEEGESCDCGPPERCIR